MRFLKIFILLLISGLLLVSPAKAQPEQYAKIRLLAERTQIAPGEEIWIALEQSIAPGWHTYWKNPGDSGLAPVLAWELPDNFTIGKIHWPVPSKFSYNDITDYGYNDQAILLQKLTIPRDLPDGAITLKLKTQILVCKEICIPESGEFELTFNDPSNMAENNRAFLDKALAKIPLPSPWDITYTEKNGELLLSITPEDPAFFETSELKELDFFPSNWGLIKGAEPLTSYIENGQLILRQMRDDRAFEDFSDIGGVLSFTNKNGDKEAITFTAIKGEIITAITRGTAPQKNTYASKLDNVHIATALLFALLGGLILNLMPCVFPVLSLKALSLAKMSGKHQTKARMNGLAYTAGIILSFLIIAGALIAFKAAGAQIGWGFQLQNPIIITFLAYLLFVIGLNLTGFFKITGHFGNIGQKLTQGNGISNSFFTGVLATLVATPCTAPFMALAIGYALIQPAPIALLIFATLGFGLALPYLILSFIPAFQRLLPKPGSWMNTFRKILSIPMFGFSLWLLSVLAQQINPTALIPVLIGFIALSITFWLLTHHPKKIILHRLAQLTVILTFIGTMAFVPSNKQAMLVQDANHVQNLSFGEEYSPNKLATLLIEDDPIFVEMTAAWCITCKINNKIAIDIEQTKELFKDHNVKYLVGDWTNYDQDITEFLSSYGRNGVPIYIYYAPRDPKTSKRPEAQLLPQILTPTIVQNIIIKPL